MKNIVKENISKLVKEINMEDQETHRVPNKMDAKKPTPRRIIIKKPKVKDKESSKSKVVHYLQGSFHKTVS